VLLEPPPQAVTVMIASADSAARPKRFLDWKVFTAPPLS
jgi:hypothetical protein